MFLKFLNTKKAEKQSNLHGELEKEIKNQLLELRR